MALRTIHQRQVCMMISSRTISSHLHILKARLNSTLGWTNQSTSRLRTTRAQEATESTQEFHDMAVDLVITTMNLLLMSRASNSSKCLAAPPRLRLPAISNRARENGTFRLIIRTTPNSIPLTTTQRLRTRTTDITISKTLWVHWTWTNSFWTTTACSKITITTTGWMERCAGRFCLLDLVPMVSPVSQDRDRFSCGSSYSNFLPINLARVSFRGLAMDGSSSWLILTR